MSLSDLVWSKTIDAIIRNKSNMKRTAMVNRKPMLSIKRRSLYRNRLKYQYENNPKKFIVTYSNCRSSTVSDASSIERTLREDTDIRKTPVISLTYVESKEIFTCPSIFMFPGVDKSLWYRGLFIWNNYWLSHRVYSIVAIHINRRIPNRQWLISS